MRKQDEIILLHLYSSGKSTWRETAEKIGVEDFAEFEAKLKEAGLSLYEPAESESEAKMNALDAILDEGL